MRFMIIVKSNQHCEDDMTPDDSFMAEMAKYNDDLAKAGVLLDLQRLEPDSKGARVRFSGGKSTVIDGPFAETKELVGGYWLWNVKSKREAIEWVKRCPVPKLGRELEIEIREVLEDDPMVAAIPQLRERRRAAVRE
jgi:hypothetical protein